MSADESTMRRSIETALASGNAPRIRYIRPLRPAEEATVVDTNSLGVFFQDARGLRHHVMWSSVTDIVAAA